MKFYEPQANDNEIPCPIYLTEELQDKVNIHRIVQPDELSHFTESELRVTEDKKFYIHIGTVRTLPEAERAIHSYWSAIDELNRRKNNNWESEIS